DRDGARVQDLLRIGVDRRRLLTERELDARPVVDRPAARRDLDALLVLAVGELREAAGLDALDPRAAEEEGGEGEREEREEEADAAVRVPLARPGHQRPRLM